MKRLFPLIILALVGAAAWWFWNREAPQAKTAEPSAAGGQITVAKPVTVEVAPVEARELARDISVVGSLRSNESVIVRPEIAGRIVSITFDEGAKVARGAVLVTLDDSVYRAELAQAEANLARDLRLQERGRQLHADNYISSTEMDQLDTAVKVDEAALALARARLQKTRLLAPFDGVLGLRRVSVGDYVGEGQDIVNIEDITPVKLDFRIPEGFLSEIRNGLPLTVHVDAYPGRNFDGRIAAIDPQVGATDRSISIRGEVPNADGLLRPGLFARVTLVLERLGKALTIPEQAIVPQGDRHFVYRVNDGKAVMTEITLGQRKEGWAQVASGLSPQDRVVTAGIQKIKDGAPIEIQATPTGSTGSP
jgi:membrane fusion protein (multidrug efflux system)